MTSIMLKAMVLAGMVLSFSVIAEEEFKSAQKNSPKGVLDNLSNKQLDLSEFWKYQLGQDNWGVKAKVKFIGKKIKIKYEPGQAGGWSWVGGRLEKALVPTVNSALYLKGKGRFTLKLEGRRGTNNNLLIRVNLKGLCTWTKVPLLKGAGNSYVIMVLDKFVEDLIITDRYYTPKGKAPILRNNSR